jgi:hypothetical protein
MQLCDGPLCDDCAQGLSGIACEGVHARMFRFVSILR